MSKDNNIPVHSVLITGADGFLGRHLYRRLAEKGFKCFPFNHRQLDITDAAAVIAAISKCKPDAVVHCAAISSTAYAGEHPGESMAVNVVGCENVARACCSTGAVLYVMSSDQVYGGCPGSEPLPETYPVCPNNIYGQHKLLMEGRVLDILPDAVALRLTWMFERYNAAAPHTDMVSRMIKAAAGSQPIKASMREYRGISDVDTVCDNIIASFGCLPGGIYNFGSGNSFDSYTTMLRVAESSGFPKELIAPDDSWGRNLSMDCSKLKTFGIGFPDTVSALTDTIKRSI